MRNILISFVGAMFVALMLPSFAVGQQPAASISSASRVVRDTTETTSELHTARYLRPGATAVLVLVPELPVPDARVVIMRRASTEPQNVILVTRKTNPNDLTKGIAALFSSRRARGDALPRDMTAHVTAAEFVPKATSQNAAQSAKDLAALRRAPVIAVAGVGSYPALTISLGDLKR